MPAARALLAMMRRASKAVREGGQLIIFPEGTRRPVGAPPAYKSGFSQIYIGCGVTCLPVALNSGLFWPRRTFMRYPRYADGRISLIRCRPACGARNSSTRSPT